MSTYNPPEPLRRAVVAVDFLEPEQDGQVRALITCDCGTATDLTVEIRDGENAVQVKDIPSGAAEMAFTCSGCQTSHWFELRAVQ